MEWVEGRFEEFAAAVCCCCLHRLVQMFECCRLLLLVCRLLFELVGRFGFLVQEGFERKLWFEFESLLAKCWAMKKAVASLTNLIYNWNQPKAKDAVTTYCTDL